MTPGLPLPRLGDRALFPDLEPAAYLAHAAVSPPSLAARRAVIAHLGDLARRGAGAFGAAVEQRARLRSKLAAFLNAPEGTVALAQNTSVGVTDVALSIPWCAGNRVVLFRGEFPANVTPWQRAAALFSLELVWCDADLWRTDPEAARAQLSDALSDGARVVAVSAVQFQTGHRMPLRELSDLAHAAGAELFVDAIQALGAVPIDVEADGVDHLASGGHKWLMGVEGAGLLYARHPERHAPHLAGWLSHTEAFSFLSEGAGRLRYDRAFRDDALRFEGGTPNAAGYVALEASVDLLAALTPEAIHAHVNAYLDALEAPLVERGFTSLRAKDPSGRSCILSVLPPAGAPDAPAMQRALAARGVVASCPDGYLRFAPHWPNDAAREVPAVLAAVDDVLKG